MRIGITNTDCLVLDADEHSKDVLSDALAIEVPGSFWIKRQRNLLHWDGKKRFYNRLTKKFPAGLLPYAIEVLGECDVPYSLMDLRVAHQPIAPVPSAAEWHQRLLDRGYPAHLRLSALHQKVIKNLSVAHLPNHPTVPWYRGLISLPTGSGKTVLSFLIRQVFGTPCLYLDCSRDRILQSRASYIQLTGKQPGLYMTAKYLDAKPMTFGMIQTIARRVKEGHPETVNWLKSIKTVLVDEAHLVGDNDYMLILKTMDQAVVRFGLGGSLLRRRDLADWNLLGCFGSVVHHTGSSDLRRYGLLADVRVFLLDVSNIKCGLRYAAAEQQCIVRNEYRNHLGALAAMRAADHGWVTLVLVSKIKHGELMQDVFGSLGVRVPFLYGEDPIEVRRQYIDLMRTQRTKIVIASRIFNAGIDVPLVRCIVRMGGDRSEISSLQIPGRGMRRKEEFNWLFLIDFNDRTSKYFHDHSKHRLRVYADEGYELTAITDIEDIPFVRVSDEDQGSHPVSC